MSGSTNVSKPHGPTCRIWLTGGIVVTVAVLAVGSDMGYRLLAGAGPELTDTKSTRCPS